MALKFDGAETIKSHFQQSMVVKQATADTCTEAILQAARVVAECFERGGKLLLCGNGGSAADCQHMAAELVSRMTRELERPGLPVIALTTDTSFLTAFANDYGYEGVFQWQVEALGRPGDVLLGISTSGNSVNVVRATEAAAARGMKTITLTGCGGKLKSLGDVSIAVPSSNTQHIQEAHLAVEHMICYLVEHTLFA